MVRFTEYALSNLMKIIKKTLRLILILGLAGTALGALAAVTAYYVLTPGLPDAQTLRDVRLRVPLRIYSRDQRLIAEFGEQRRTPVTYQDIPPAFVKAFLAAEDARFFEHPGVDYQGILRAALHLLRTGRKGQGGSTITMQVARNFFLSREKTYLRKLNEIFLALKIEQALSKEEILSLYANKIYLGHRAYGIEAASQVYYGKPIQALDLAQIAMIAGLPKAPSRYNPIANPPRAILRRNYVLKRMRELGFISEPEYRQARERPVTASVHAPAIEVEAPYIAEMVRSELLRQYGDDVYSIGLRVFTTLDADKQAAANRALRADLLAYDRRHGYRGPERHVDLAELANDAEQLALLKGIPRIGGLEPALVLEAGDKQARLRLRDGRIIALDWDGMAWARRHIDERRRGPAPRAATDILAPGDIVRLESLPEENWKLARVPAVAGALVALSPVDGAIRALTGGFDFYHSKFNRAVQARRQPGSSFKPFIYAAALENGFTPASLINDAPVVFEDEALESTWRPENYSGRFYGPTRLRVALINSRNLVSIRLLRAIGVDTAIEYVKRFGIDTGRLPRNLSLSLGSGSMTPLEVATAYTVFANGGYRIEPYFIDHIEDTAGAIIFEARPSLACAPCETPDTSRPAADEQGVRLPERPAPRVLDKRVNYLMNSMLRDVVRLGTGRGAMRLGRKDLAGKTGTTNDQRDAWFTGYNHALVATAWVGFDQVRSLGPRETGGRAALPMWRSFMARALQGVAERPLEKPDGLVTVRIDPKTGLLAPSGLSPAIFETFRSENAPAALASPAPQATPEQEENLTSDIF